MLEPLKKRKFENGDALVLEKLTDTFEAVGKLTVLQLYYQSKVFDHKIGHEVEHKCGLQYFHPEDIDLANEDFQNRLNNRERKYDFSLEEIRNQYLNT